MSADMGIPDFEVESHEGETQQIKVMAGELKMSQDNVIDAIIKAAKEEAIEFAKTGRFHVPKSIDPESDDSRHQARLRQILEPVLPELGTYFLEAVKGTLEKIEGDAEWEDKIGGEEETEADVEERASRDIKATQNKVANGAAPDVDFTDATDTIATLPEKGTQARADLWKNMKMNNNILKKAPKQSRAGVLYHSVDTACSFEVSAKGATVRPIVTIRISGERDIANARMAINSRTANEFVTQPSMPVLLNVNFPKSCTEETAMRLREATTGVELQPATIGQIMKVAILLHSTQQFHWDLDEKSWKWDVVGGSKKGGEGEEDEILGLMKTNPAFLYVPETDVKTTSLAQTVPVTADTKAPTQSEDSEAETDIESQYEDDEEAGDVVDEGTESNANGGGGWLKNIGRVVTRRS